MNFLNSVFFGFDGSYNIFGTKVEFCENPPGLSIHLDGAGIISRLAIHCMKSNVLRWITQGYTHVFVHEMSHAIAYKLLTGKNAEKILVSSSSCEGVVLFPQSMADISAWKRTVISVAGSMGDISFSICKLFSAIVLKSYLPSPVTLTLVGGALCWISGEVLYAYVSGSKKDHGDFGHIASHGKTHLMLASTALVCQITLGIFTAIKLAA